MNKINALLNVLKAHNINYKENQILKNYTTLHIGGSISCLVEPNNIEEIILCLSSCTEYEIPYYVLGHGSNVLGLDRGYDGLILVLPTHFNHVTRKGKLLYVESGMSLKELCEFACKQQLDGLSFACGIPGSVGGAIVMNAGAYDGEISDVVKQVTYLDEAFNIKVLTKKELAFNYRHSYFSDHKGIVLEAVFECKQGKTSVIQARMNELNRARRASQPLSDYSAGSTFKRPLGNYASGLIKEANLSGFKVGDASVSSKHTGFLINQGNATSNDFLTLIKEVQKRVKIKSGYELECEIKIIE
ncbi:MAG: UDP-N-acetylmuramate dehydrogenase [Erysipelotrichaceae bacterium]